MPRDPLGVLWRVRDAAVTEASRELAAIRAGKLRLVSQLDAHLAAVNHERDRASADLSPEFIAWLPHARSETIRLQAAVAKERARADACQQVLVRRRIEAEAVAKAIERRRERDAAVQTRKEQAAMDEAASRSAAR